MSVDDFWLRLCDLSTDIAPSSEAKAIEAIDRLVIEYGRFPTTTQEALRGHVTILISRLSQLHARLM